MSFTVELQKNLSEKNRLNKDIDTISSVSGVLRDSTSIINPVIMVEGNPDDFSTCNYMTISDFNRSYFITDIRSVRNNLVEISGHVDVLSSYASYIKRNYAIIYRQENKWNLYLDDGSFKIYQNPNIVAKEFPSGFSTQEYVLAVAGS